MRATKRREICLFMSAYLSASVENQVPGGKQLLSKSSFNADRERSVKNCLFITSAKFSEKLTFITPDTHIYLCASECNKC